MWISDVGYKNCTALCMCRSVCSTAVYLTAVYLIVVGAVYLIVMTHVILQLITYQVFYDIYGTLS